MLSRIWFLGAVFWTLFVSVICLVRFPEVPEVGISDADKYVHAIIHLIFTVFWTLHFRINTRFSIFKAGSIVFVMSILFGIAIELAQYFLTETRSGDSLDILANCIGSLIGLLLLALFNKKIGITE